MLFSCACNAFPGTPLSSSSSSCELLRKAWGCPALLARHSLTLEPALESGRSAKPVSPSWCSACQLSKPLPAFHCRSACPLHRQAALRCRGQHRRSFSWSDRGGWLPLTFLPGWIDICPRRLWAENPLENAVWRINDISYLHRCKMVSIKQMINTHIALSIITNW